MAGNSDVTTVTVPSPTTLWIPKVGTPGMIGKFAMNFVAVGITSVPVIAPGVPFGESVPSMAPIVPSAVGVAG